MHMMKPIKNEHAGIKHRNSEQPRSADTYTTELELQRAQLTEVLEEMFLLLEEYAPTWYTERHHDDVETVLNRVRGSDRAPCTNSALQQSSGTILSS